MKPFIPLLIITVATISCQHVYYSPNTAHAPLLTEKGESRINALYANGGDSELKGFELQAAHAVSKQFAVMANFFSAAEKEEFTDVNNNQVSEKGNGNYFEIGGGYFRPLDENRRWVAEGYAGFGLGTVSNDYFYGDHSKVGFSKFFLQPAMGYKSPYFEIAFVPKVSFVSWNVKKSHIVHTENDDARSEISAVKDKKRFTAFEPALLLRAGGKGFKFHLSLSFSNYEATDVFVGDLTEPLVLGMGISVNLKPAKK